MIQNSCLKIETKKFPILQGEEEEIVNDNMYGKALCQYLESNLSNTSIEVKGYFAEDWGWLIDVKVKNFTMGLCVYSDPDANGDPEKYGIMPSIHSEKVWSWSKFKKVDVSKNVLEIIEVIESIFSNDKEISSVTKHNDFPF